MAIKTRCLLELTTKQQAQFWLQIKSTDKLACWEWQAHKDKDGYGKFKTFGSHRYVYYLWYGIDPKEKCVCHTCDNPSCCNPYHLWLGTTEENTADKVIKNRQAKGEDNRAILTASDVRIILTIGYSQPLQKTAELFGVNYRTISSVLTGVSWKHIYQEFINE